jgi:hypothetical protein
MTYYYINLKNIGKRQIVTENKELVCQFAMTLEGHEAYCMFCDGVEAAGGQIKSWALATYKKAA